MTRCDRAVDAVLVVGTIGGGQFDRASHLIDQDPNQGDVVDVARDRRRRNLTDTGVHRDVQAAPRPPRHRPAFLDQPFPGAEVLQASAIDEQVFRGMRQNTVLNVSAITLWDLVVADARSSQFWETDKPAAPSERCPLPTVHDQ